MIEHGIALQDGQWKLIRIQFPFVGSPRWGWSLNRNSTCVGRICLPRLGDNWQAYVYTNEKRMTVENCIATVFSDVAEFTGDAHQCIEWLWNRRHELMPE